MCKGLKGMFTQFLRFSINKNTTNKKILFKKFRLFESYIFCWNIAKIPLHTLGYISLLRYSTSDRGKHLSIGRLSTIRLYKLLIPTKPHLSCCHTTLWHFKIQYKKLAGFGPLWRAEDQKLDIICFDFMWGFARKGNILNFGK